MSQATGQAEQQAASDLLQHVFRTARVRDRYSPKARASLPWRASDASSNEIVAALTRFLFAARMGWDIETARQASVSVGTRHAMLETDYDEHFICQVDRGEDDDELEEEISVWLPSSGW